MPAKRTIALATLFLLLPMGPAQAGAQEGSGSDDANDERLSAIQSLMDLIDIAGESEEVLSQIQDARDALDELNADPDAEKLEAARLTDAESGGSNWLAMNESSCIAPDTRSKAADHISWVSLAPSMACSKWIIGSADPHGSSWSGRNRRFESREITIEPGSILIMPACGHAREIAIFEQSGDGTTPHVYLRKGGRILASCLKSSRRGSIFHSGLRGQSPTGGVSWCVPAGFEIVAWNRSSPDDPWHGIAVWVESDTDPGT